MHQFLLRSHSIGQFVKLGIYEFISEIPEHVSSIHLQRRLESSRSSEVMTCCDLLFTAMYFLSPLITDLKAKTVIRGTYNLSFLNIEGSNPRMQICDGNSWNWLNKLGISYLDIVKHWVFEILH